MLSVFQTLFEEWVMEEKDFRDAREKVRAAMREQFTLGWRAEDDDVDEKFPRPASASPGDAVKPYIPPTVPSDDPYSPFGLKEPPLR